MNMFSGYDFSTMQWISIGVILFAFLAMIILGATRTGDIFYAITQNWKVSISAFILILLTLLFGVFHEPVTRGIQSAYWRVVLKEGPDVITRVQHCRGFLEAMQNGQSYTPPAEDKGGLKKHNPAKYWDICAAAFGKNYWKYDISVNGQNGGALFCALYEAQQDIASPTADVWCDTVLKQH